MTVKEMDLHEVAQSFGRRRMRLRRPSIITTVAIVCIGSMLLTAAVGPMLVSDPNTLSRDFLQGPSRSHWFGTDNLGRDILSKLIYGAMI